MKYFVFISVTLVAVMECRSVNPSSMEEGNKHWRARVLQRGEDTSSTPTGTLVATEPSDSNAPLFLMDSDFHAIGKKSSNYPEELRPFIVTQGRKLEKLLAEFADRTTNARNHEQRASQWLKQLKLILKELSGEAVPKENNGDEINEIVDSTMPALQGNQVMKKMNNLKELIDNAEALDIYYQDEQDGERHIKSRFDDSSALFPTDQKSADTEEIKDMKKGAEHMNEMLIEVQNQVGHVRKFFDRLCRKHHSMPSSSELSEYNHNHVMNSDQPNKISIL